MFHMKERLLLRPQLSGVTALILHHSVFILLLACAGESSQPIVAMVGDDIVLPCQMERAVDASSLTVEWSRSDLNPRFVHLRRDSVELLLEENPAYKGRTSLSTSKLKRGDVSLKLSTVKVSDEGTYRGYVPSGTPTDCVVQLAVGSVSSPDIKISKVSNGVLLVCKSEGWYPEPEVFWLDGEGNLLSAGPTETVRGPDDLYTVSSRVTVEKRHSNSFTCRVQQNHINQTRETLIHVPDELFLVESSSALRISIWLIVCLLAVVAVVFVVWKWGRNKAETKTPSNELQLLIEEDRQRLELMTASERIEYLEKTKVKLQEDLQKTEGELVDVQQVIATLMDQKKDLNKQKDKLISLQQEDNTKITEKKNDKPVLKKEAKMNKLTNLEKTLKEHEELLKNTNNMLEKTEGLIIKMTERKTNLERDKKQIDENLKENKRQRGETERKLQSERENKTNQPPSSDSV